MITRSFVGDGSELALWGQPATPHGTACAEVIHDVVPDALLYLVNFGSETEWAAVVDWLLAVAPQFTISPAGWCVGGV